MILFMLVSSFYRNEENYKIKLILTASADPIGRPNGNIKL